MNLPEIKHLVGQHLDRNTLARCLRVSRDWHGSFIPLVYHNLGPCYGIDYYGSEKRNRFRDPESLSMVHGLRRNGHLVRVLQVRLESMEPFFTNLLIATVNSIQELTLTMHMRVPQYDRNIKSIDPPTNYLAEGLQLLSSNPSIQRLILTDSTTDIVGAVTTKHWDLIPLFCPALQEIRLIAVQIHLLTLVQLIKACPTLSLFLIAYSRIDNCRYTFLSMGDDGGYAFPALTVGDEGLIFPKIKTLQFEMNAGLDLSVLERIVRHCPALKTFRWYNSVPSAFIQEEPFSDLTLFKNCSCLSTLLLSRLGLNDQDLAQVLEHCPRLTDLTVCDSKSIGNRTFEALTGLFPMLRVLRVNLGTRGHWTTQILQSCPFLEELTTHVLKVDDCFLSNALVVDETSKGEEEGQDSMDPWVCCSGLRRLMIYSLVLSSEAGRNKQVEQSLASLQNLEGLSVIDIQQNQGQDENEGLFTKLSRNQAFITRDQMTQDLDLRWMLKTWPKLNEYTRTTPSWEYGRM